MNPYLIELILYDLNKWGERQHDRSVASSLCSHFVRSHVILLISRLLISKLTNTFGIMLYPLSIWLKCKQGFPLCTGWADVGYTNRWPVFVRQRQHVERCQARLELPSWFRPTLPPLPKKGICSLFWSWATEPHPSMWQHMVLHCSYLYSQINKTIPAISFTLLSFTVIISSSIHISSMCV